MQNAYLDLFHLNVQVAEAEIPKLIISLRRLNDDRYIYQPVLSKINPVVIIFFKQILSVQKSSYVCVIISNISCYQNCLEYDTLGCLSAPIQVSPLQSWPYPKCGFVEFIWHSCSIHVAFIWHSYGIHMAFILKHRHLIETNRVLYHHFRSGTEAEPQQA